MMGRDHRASSRRSHQQMLESCGREGLDLGRLRRRWLLACLRQTWSISALASYYTQQRSLIQMFCSKQPKPAPLTRPHVAYLRGQPLLPFRPSVLPSRNPSKERGVSGGGHTSIPLDDYHRERVFPFPTNGTPRQPSIDDNRTWPRSCRRT
jgi:hypothetical protein